MDDTGENGVPGEARLESSGRESYLVAKHLPGAGAGSVLLVDCGDASFADSLASAMPGARFFSQDFALHRRLPADRAEFGAWYSGGPHDIAVVYAPKARARARMNLAMAAAAVAPGGQLWVVGAKTSGIGPLGVFMGEMLDGRVESDAARHCVLHRAKVARKVETGPLDSLATMAKVVAGKREMSLAGLPGVFAEGRLDEGTAFLLEAPSLKPASAVLDFGCGSGAIGTWLKLEWPKASVEMTDSDALAVEASRRTLAANGLSADEVRASDLFSELRGNYDLIISNPPFHSGTGTEYAVTGEFVRESRRRLNKGGRLRVVCNKFLRHGHVMEEVFRNIKTVAEDGRYAVLESVRKG
jgi:16S rRNA (guanine1207-N2)-methyltransferase